MINNFNISSKTKFSKFNQLLIWIAIFVLIISSYNLFEFRWESKFLNSIPQKDEVGFLNGFNFYLINGWYESVKSGTSPLFNLFGYFIYCVTENKLLSLKILSIVSLFLIVFFWTLFLFKDFAVKGLNLFLAFLLLLNMALVRDVYFFAVDDPLFIVFMSLTFIFLYRSISNPYKSFFYSILVGVSYAAALSVRALFVFYFFGLFMILLILLINKSINLKYIFSMVSSFMITVLIIHYPSINEKKKLSFHSKDFKGEKVTYAEINYLGLIRNKENLLRGRIHKLRPTSMEVIQYRQNHGQDALPKTYLDGILKSPEITVKNFFGLFLLHILPFIRQLGFIYVFFILYTLYSYIFRKSDKLSLWIPFLFYLLFAISLCISPVLFMEFRWFMMFTLLITVFFLKIMYNIKKNFPYLETIYLINIIGIGLLNGFLVGIW